MNPHDRALIDELGLVKAEITGLVERETAIKAELVGLKPGTYDGDLFRLIIAEGLRHRLDMDAVKAELSVAFIEENTISTNVRSYRVVKR